MGLEGFIALTGKLLRPLNDPRHLPRSRNGRKGRWAPKPELGQRAPEFLESWEGSVCPRVDLSIATVFGVDVDP